MIAMIYSFYYIAYVNMYVEDSDHCYTAGRKNGIIEILVSINQFFVAKIAHYCLLNKAILPIPKNGLIDRGYRFLFVR